MVGLRYDNTVTPAGKSVAVAVCGTLTLIGTVLSTSVLQSRDAHGTMRHARDHDHILIARVASLKSPPPHRRDRRTWILGLSFPSLSFSGDSRSNYITLGKSRRGDQLLPPKLDRSNRLKKRWSNLHFTSILPLNIPNTLMIN